ncbi:hypothetical protein KAW43_00580 [Candidatus Parcubacteria bacterium]|nr:hypothetical protein [Candidatus Parcubacteria bacterium]
MREKLPTFEFKKEEEPEQKLIRLLKEKGVEDPEARKLLLSWTIEQEKQVEKSDDPEAPIQFNLRRARLYFDAGYRKAADENFEAARTQAWNENKKKLYQAIMKEMDEIENSIEEQK